MQTFLLFSCLSVFLYVNLLSDVQYIYNEIWARLFGQTVPKFFNRFIDLNVLFQGFDTGDGSGYSINKPALQPLFMVWKYFGILCGSKRA